MKTKLLQELTVTTATTAIMRYTLALAIVQILGVILFAAWSLSL